MQRLLLLFFAAATLVSAAVATAQVNLSWNQCTPHPAASDQKFFNCAFDTAQALLLVPSFKLSSDVQGFTGVELTILLLADPPFLPQWWSYGPGECRSGNLFVTDPFLAGNGCANPYAGWAGGGGGITYQSGTPIPNAARMDVNFFRVDPFPLQANVEYAAAAIYILTELEPATCEGCCTPVCLLVEHIDVQSTGGTVRLSGPLVRDQVGWQGGNFGTPTGCFGLGCPDPARNRTWGEIKSLYR